MDGDEGRSESPSTTGDYDDNFRIISNVSSSSHPLPSLLDDQGCLLDRTNDVFECYLCPERKFPSALLETHHQKFHGRDNLLCSLRTIVKELGTPAFGPAEPGMLVKVETGDDDALLKPKVTREEIAAWLKSKDRRPFLPLEYLEGHKVTVGNTFVSRKVQGEFKYLSLASPEEGTEKKKKEESYFGLEYREEGLWISVNNLGGVDLLEPSTVVSVNEVPLLLDALGRKVVFGDIVSISVGHEEEGQRTDSVDFIFKSMREMPTKPIDVVDDPPPSKDEEGRVVTPLDNPLVVEKILHFLPTEDVKTARFLSSLWSGEALPVLRNRVRISILIMLTCPCCSNDVMGDITYFIHSDVLPHKFPHWTLFLRGDEGPEGDLEVMRAKKTLDDLAWLFEYSHNVKSLNLDVRQGTETDLQMLKTVLAGVKGTLTELNLKVKILPTFSPLLPLDPLEALEILSLCIYHSSEEESTQINVRPFVKSLLRSVPNIRELHLSHPTRAPFPLILEEVIAIQEEGPQGFANLSRIEIGGNGSITTLLQPLASIREGSLKKLVFYPPLEMPSQARGLRSVLERQAESLEALFLYISCVGGEGEEEGTVVKIQFPNRMPVLEDLYLILSLDQAPPSNYSLELGFGGESGGGRVYYRRRFPSLTNIFVWPQRLDLDSWVQDAEDTTWPSFLPFLTPFIMPWIDEEGEDGAVVVPITSATRLKIPWLLNGKYHPILDDLETTFPNVVFPPELAAAREGPVWREGEEEEA